MLNYFFCLVKIDEFVIVLVVNVAMPFCFLC